MHILFKISLLFFFITSFKYCAAQTTASPANDTLRTIEILGARSMRQITADSGTVLQTLAGNASVKQGNTILNGDSIVLNQLTGVAEVFGHVHVNDADSVHTYADYLKYVGNERIAYLKRNVKLTDGKAVLTTNDLEYNLATGIATYKDGGKVINDKTVLTSRDAVYYSDTKDVFFKKDVHLVDPKYDMHADSLRYNTAFKEAYFISPTHIISENGIIDTRSGTYNLETGEAVFLDRTTFRDSSSFLSGNKVAFDEKTNTIQVEGNGKFVDSAHNVTVLGDQLLIDKKNSTFLATRKPVMIFYRDNDSTYVAADTLFSGLRRNDPTEQKLTAIPDTSKQQIAETKDSSGFIPVTVKDTIGTSQAIKGDSSRRPDNDTLAREMNARLGSLNQNLRSLKDSGKNILKDSLAFDSTQAQRSKDSINNILKINIDTSLNKTNVTDIIAQPVAVNLNTTSKDSVRYFIGFHHVRIFNDSLQAVSDSLHYSTEDSTFKLFGSPVFWNDETQVKGDTMYMFTENQKAKRLYVFFNGIVINKTKDGLYNQAGGRTINGYFKDGAIDYIRIKGTPAESIFYPQDDDSAYIGMNRSKGDLLDIYFVKKELNKIKFVNDVDGTLYPLKQIPKDMKFLKNFLWEDNRRPKNKLELFE